MDKLPCIARPYRTGTGKRFSRSIPQAQRRGRPVWDAEGAKLATGEARRNSQAKGPCSQPLWKVERSARARRETPTVQACSVECRYEEQANLSGPLQRRVAERYASLVFNRQTTT